MKSESMSAHPTGHSSASEHKHQHSRRLFDQKLSAATVIARVKTLSRKTLFFSLIAFGFVLTFVITGFAKDDTSLTMPSRPLPVQTALVTQEPFDRYLEALGTVTPAQTVVVNSRVDGELMQIFFEEGQRVKAGELLAQLDPRPFQVELAQMLGQRSRDEALLSNAQKDLKRYQDLLKLDSASQQQVDSQESLVAQYSGNLELSQAQIKSAKLNLDYTTITAPISGRIGLRRVDVGNQVKAGDTQGIAVITQDQPIDVLFTINEQDIPNIADKVYQGVAFPVEAWDRSRQKMVAKGVMTTMDNQIDTATGTVKVKARFENDDQKLFPNQFVNIRVKVATLPDAVQVPVSAVVRGSQGTIAYVVRNGKDNSTAELRHVTIGDEGNGKRVIFAGLKAGERVVTDGTDRLRNGIAIEDVTGAGSKVVTRQ
jgi:multidrug efflux system membrane fusion protein